MYVAVVNFWKSFWSQSGKLDVYSLIIGMSKIQKSKLYCDFPRGYPLDFQIFFFFFAWGTLIIHLLNGGYITAKTNMQSLKSYYYQLSFCQMTSVNPWILNSFSSNNFMTSFPKNDIQYSWNWNVNQWNLPSNKTSYVKNQEELFKSEHQTSFILVNSKFEDVNFKFLFHYATTFLVLHSIFQYCHNSYMEYNT